MKFKFPYWYLLVIPILLYSLGVVSNQVVLIANHGKFPVLLNEAKLTKFCPSPDEIDPKYRKIACASDGSGGKYIDLTHVVMDDTSRLKLLSDVIDLHSEIVSIGDVLIFLGDFLGGILPVMWLGLILRKLMSSDKV